MPAILFPYSSTATLYFALIGSGTAAHSTAGSGSLVGTNVRVSKDGGAFATSTNTGTALPGLGFYSLVLTDTEMAAKQILVNIAGSGGSLGTLVEAQAFLIHTYGSASALYTFMGAGSAGTPLVNLVANQSTATMGTVLFVATGTITQVGTVSLVLSGSVGTVTGVVSANAIQILGTALVGTSGTLTNVGTVGLLLTGTVTTVINTILANVVQVSGTAVVATAGRMNVGSATIINVASANIVQILGTAAVGTSGTLTNIGTVTTPGSANLTEILGTAVVGTQGTLTNIGTAGTVLGTLSANVLAINGTALAAQLLARSAGVIASGSATGTISAAIFETDLTLTGSDQLKGRIVLFLSGTMQYEASDITVYRGSSVGTLGRLTVSTLHAVPSDGVSFIIV